MVKIIQPNADRVYLFALGADKLVGSLFATVQMVYFATHVTQDPLRLVLIWTVFQVTVLLFEIPTGVVADVYSRRWSVILAYFMIGVGNLVVGGFTQYSLVLVGMTILGIADSFLSGALDAWIADEIGPERVGDLYLRGSQVAQVAILTGIPIGTALGTLTLNTPMLLAGILYLLLGLVLVPIMPEVGFHPVPVSERQSWKALFRTFRAGFQLVRVKPVLVTIFIISAVSGISTAGFEGLWTPHMLENLAFPTLGHFEPVVWFGAINAAVTLLSLAGMEYFRRRVDVSSQDDIVRVLVVSSGLTAVCMLLFGVVDHFWLAAGVYILSYSLRIASSPMNRAWINQNVESRVRATVLSMDNQVHYLGRMTGGPFIGALGSAISLPLALVTAGVLRLPVTWLYARVLMKGRIRNTS